MSNTLQFTWSALRIWREDFRSMATVVDLRKSNSYKLLVLMTRFDGKALVMSLFVWCMSGAPHAFDGKTCACDELICAPHVVDC